MSSDPGSGLRQRLLDAAVRLLGEGGPEKTTLRAIARRAGVSLGAPAQYFPSLVALLDEVAADDFQGSEASLESVATVSAADHPHLRLAVSGRGCMSFAFVSPECSASCGGRTWSTSPPRPAPPRPAPPRPAPPLAETAGACFSGPIRLVEACQHQGWREDLETGLPADSPSGTVHGMTQLWQDGVLEPTNVAASIDEVGDVAFGLLCTWGFPTAAGSDRPSRCRRSVTVESRPEGSGGRRP